MSDSKESLDIAVVGMTGRFPGAKNLDEFWQNLRDGVESISFFTDEELESMGVDSAALRNPTFVKAGPILKEVDLFDAAFFGYSPREAELLDPQHRIFLECAWEALESAGCSPDRYEGLIGVYAGMSLSTYLLYNLLASPRATNPEDSFQIMMGNDKDFLGTRVSYELNLRGPSIDVQTGCSTSLVAIHLASQSLLSYHCDMALAGGISIQVPQRTGYYFQEGGLTSPDGHCRAFDAQAQGTLFGSGVGIVVLKRLADALADGDCIHAVIKGSAINNDGSLKIGYTAPGVDGQAEVIATAQAIAGIEAETIGYIEAHGTGTALGDPVEMTALTKAFRASTDKNGFCAIGSVKTNIGHLDAAAGVAGFIKTVLALKHKMLPPSLHFREPNPKIDFEDSPFYVQATLSDWKTNGMPRRAGVSSFGIGGTNAHIILEEAPPRAASSESRPWQLLLLSARTSLAVETATANLVDILKPHPDINLADVAYTYQMGRKTFNYRRMAVCRDMDDAVATLEALDPQRVFTVYQEPGDRPILFMFPGGGAQYVNMGLDLYRTEPTFSQQVDLCSEILQKRFGYDVREFLYPEEQRTKQAAEPMKQTSIGLPALFVVEYAMAKLWMSWGIEPQAMIGHSLGEYVAACLAGVFSLEDALALVDVRGKLFEQLPSGAMLSIPLPEREVRPLLNGQLSLAAINGPAQCVVSGPMRAIEAMAAMLTEKEMEFRRIQIDVAAHSEMVEPILNPFRNFVENLDLQAPEIPFISNVTGTWITAAEATDPNYWASHLRRTVRFGDGIEELLKESNRILLEVGPGQTLSTLAKLQIDAKRGHTVLSSIRHPYDRPSDVAFLLTTLGKLWMAGVAVDWSGFYAHERRHRLPLPTYPFERQRYWVEPRKHAYGLSGYPDPLGKKSNIADWFYIPSWKRSTPPPPLKPGALAEQSQIWLVFEDECGIGSGLANRLEQESQNVIRVRAAEQFHKISDAVYTINPGTRDDYDALFKELNSVGKIPDRIVHLWSMTPSHQISTGLDLFRKVQATGFYSLLFLAQAAGEQNLADPLQLWVVCNNLQEVESADVSYPEKATILGPCKVIPQECENITCHCIDVVVPESGTRQEEQLINQLLAEVSATSSDLIVAYRGHQRWVQIYDPVRLDGDAEPIRPLRKHGVYLLTGGLGGIGLLLAEYLARTVQPKLILIGRSVFPAKDQWEQWLATHDEQDGVSRKIRQVQALEELGAEVLIVSADVADESQMRSIMAQLYERFGELHGVIHAAGIAGEKTVKLIPDVDPAGCEIHFQGKVYGSYILERVLHNKELDFCLLFSSNVSILGGLGSIAYSAANLFMDSFALNRSRTSRTPWISANWDGWLLEEENRLSSSFQTSIDQYAMTRRESVEAFNRVVSTAAAGQMVVSTGDLPSRLSVWIDREALKGTDAAKDGDGSAALHPRPALGTAYVPPSTEVEETIVKIWQQLLGIEQLGIHDNFFDLGGNSLIGLKVISRLKRELNVDIPVVALFEGPTVSALAKVIAQDRTETPVYEESRSRGERRREKRRRKQNAAESA
jgi:acyl transferase domain-containing protein/acyl carrier protein